MNQGFRVKQGVAKPTPQTATDKTKKLEVPPEVLLDATYAVMCDLMALMEEEVRLVKKGDLAKMQALVPNKKKLIQSYESNVAALRAVGPALKNCDPAKRAFVREMGQKMEKITQRNATVLQGAITATRCLFENIIKALRHEALPSLGYAHLGDASAHTGPASERLCPAVSVRKTV